MSLKFSGKCTVKVAVLAICATAGSVAAQQQITPEAFLARANGQTLTFTDYHSSQIVGVEQFLSTKLSVWAETDGRCSYGNIEQRGPLVCFIYEDFPNDENCWTPFEKNGDLLVISSATYEIQQVTKISNEPVICEGAPLS